MSHHLSETLDSLYDRRPLRFTVLVDRRPIGEPFANQQAAEMQAEELYHEAPWTAVEVVASY